MLSWERDDGDDDDDDADADDPKKKCCDFNGFSLFICWIQYLIHF